MPALDWILAALLVCLASGLQAATGAGLGLIAGPALILVMGSTAAIPVAIVMNLIVSFALLPKEHKAVDRPALTWLSIGTVLGIPLGVLVLGLLDLTALKIVAGLAVLAGAVQVLRGRRRGGARSPSDGGLRHSLGFGLVSGVMSASLAMPGPAAMCALARTGQAATVVRATLRALFVVSYGAALLVHAVMGIRWDHLASVTLVLLPVVVAGILAGHLAQTRLSERALGNALTLMLFLMGASLLGNGLWDMPFDV